MSGFDPARAVNVEDLRELARRRVPRMVFDYIDGGADAEITLRGNCRVFDDITFRPRAAVSTATVDLRTTVAGTSIALPFLLAPIGSSRMFYPRGEVAAARAAGRAGTAYILSTLSGCRARRRQGRLWRPSLVSGLSRWRARRRSRRDRSSEGRRFRSARGHHGHARRRPA